MADPMAMDPAKGESLQGTNENTPKTQDDAPQDLKEETGKAQEEPADPSHGNLLQGTNETTSTTQDNAPQGIKEEKSKEPLDQNEQTATTKGEVLQVPNEDSSKAQPWREWLPKDGAADPSSEKPWVGWKPDPANESAKPWVDWVKTAGINGAAPSGNAGG